MVGLYAALSREHGLGALVRHWGRCLGSAALLALVVPAMIAAAPAAADPPAVTINHLPARQCGDPVDGGAYYCVGSAPIIKVIFPRPRPQSDYFSGLPYEYVVDNVEPGHVNGFGTSYPGTDEISDVILTFNQAPTSYNGPYYNPEDTLASFEATCSGGLTLDCSTPYGIPGNGLRGDGLPDGAHEFTLYYEGSGGSDPGLDSVDVEFNLGVFTPCSAPYGPAAGGAGDAARTADACTPPSHTKITQAKIHGNTSFFRFTARHTTRFECVLQRNHEVMFRHSCHSPKRYASPLPHGHYTFIVTGVNQGGLDPKPATKKFTVK